MTLRYRLWNAVASYDDFIEEARSRFEDSVVISVKRRGDKKDIYLDTRSLHYRYATLPFRFYRPNEAHFAAIGVGKKLERDGFLINLYGQNSMREVNEHIKKKMNEVISSI